MFKDHFIFALLCLALLTPLQQAFAKDLQQAGDKRLRIAAARSVADTGLIERLIAGFAAFHPGVDIQLEKVGALTALEYAQSGRADFIITHYAPEEYRLVNEGWATKRVELLASRYVIVGPGDDELELSQQENVLEALISLHQSEVDIVVPSPRSGTYRKITELWAAAGLEPKGIVYENTGSSALSTLQQADIMGAYTIADLGLYLQQNKNEKLTIKPLYGDDIRLENKFSGLIVNAAKVTGANQSLAEVFMDYLISTDTQEMIARYGKETYGTVLYTPIANKDRHVITGKLSEKLQQTRTWRNIWLAISIFYLVLGGMLFYFMRRSYKLKYQNLQMQRALDTAEQERQIAIFENQAKSEFLSRMSHELRTPLNAIMGFTQILQLDINENHPPNKKHIDEVLKASTYLLQLIDELLELSRIESGKVHLSREEIHVSDIINKCLNMVAVYPKQYNVDINLHERGKYVVFADSKRLQQVLLNLLSNAFKYNRPGGKIDISVFETNNDMIRIEIADTGPGLTEEEQLRVFTPFERLNQNNTHGTGLGLAICKNFVELMQGRIGVKSQPGHGSTFWVELPQPTVLIDNSHQQTALAS